MMQANQVVGLRKRGEDGTDSHGNPVPTYAAAVPVRVYGYGPRSAEGGAEPSKQGRDVVIIGQTVYAPPVLVNANTQEPVEASPLDRFEVPFGGELYEVDGEIGDWNHGPFGWTPGLSISLKRAEG